MSNHSVVEHRANYYYIRIEEDYLALCSRGECSPHCKALILAILEHWMNTKRDKGEGEYVYLTMPEWIKHTYMLYERNVITDCIKELMDDGLVTRRPIKRHDQNTFEYTLNLDALNARIRALPEKSMKETLPNLGPYLAFKDRAKAKRAKGRKEVGDKSRTPSKGQKEVREKSITVGDKSRTVREKSTQHSSHTEITDLDSRDTRSSASTQANVEHTTTAIETDKIPPPLRKRMQTVLTPDEQRWFERVWCQSSFIKVPSLPQSLTGHIQQFARSLSAVEQLNGLYAFAKERLLANPNRQDDIVKPGNMASALNDFLLAEQNKMLQNQLVHGPGAMYTEQELDRVVWWTQDPDTAFYGRLEDHLHQLERMTIREAKQYRYGEFAPFTNEEEAYITRCLTPEGELAVTKG